MNTMQLPVYNQQGQKISTLKVSDALFGAKPKSAVLHQAVVAQENNARYPIAHTKKRGEVRGGGRKPWKQKGTGRARHGSIRSPIWRGGGVVFGPSAQRNFTQKINKKVRRAAILMALSDKVASDTIRIVDHLDGLPQKTKAVVQMLGALSLGRGKTLLALPQASKAMARTFRNVSRVTPIAAGSLNVVDLLKHVNLVTTMAGIKEIERVYGSK